MFNVLYIGIGIVDTLCILLKIVWLLFFVLFVRMACLLGGVIVNSLAERSERRDALVI